MKGTRLYLNKSETLKNLFFCLIDYWILLHLKKSNWQLRISLRGSVRWFTVLHKIRRSRMSHDIVCYMVAMKTCWFNLGTFCLTLILAINNNLMGQSACIWHCHIYNYFAKRLDQSGDVRLCIISCEICQVFNRKW